MKANPLNPLLDKIRDSLIGENSPLETVFGKKPLVYADYTASGRALQSIEDFIQKRVLPGYANTHSEASFTGRQTTFLREEAREQIKRATNAGPEHALIFCGSGATAAIQKLIDIMNLRLPADLNQRYQLENLIPEKERPVVFIGPYEHHSNEVLWRESLAEVVVIPEDQKGQVELARLQVELKRYKNRDLRIGSFSAASNVTGIISQIDEITALLKEHGALSFWDYAAAAPYKNLQMRGPGSGKQGPDNSKDAVFISPHKFVGGPGAAGILLVKKSLLRNKVPVVPGGGTVFYVTPESHSYLESSERREEGGTPGIIGAIRAGLVFQLQSQVGLKEIERREKDFLKRAKARLGKIKNLEILGERGAPRLSIFSFQIHREDKCLHYGFIVALLNDLFGIQARGGCSCAGPYSHSLLCMDMNYSRAVETQLSKGQGIIRQGWVRLNFNYFISEETFEYILRALELICLYGHKLLPAYQFDPTNNCWWYENRKLPLPARLADFDITSAASDNITPLLPGRKKSLAVALREAERELKKNHSAKSFKPLRLTSEVEKLRRFAMPGDRPRENKTPDINGKAAQSTKNTARKINGADGILSGRRRSSAPELKS